jgi:hypothetical protein
MSLSAVPCNGCAAAAPSLGGTPLLVLLVGAVEADDSNALKRGWV